MSGGKGGSQTTQVEIPQWLENAAQANLAQGRDVSRIGYVPYYGPDVAAFTPTQESAMSNTSQFAQAFGLQGGGPSQMPEATDFGGGIRGYSSGGLYDRAVAELAVRRPGQYQQIMRNFVNPFGSGGYQDPYANYFNQTGGAAPGAGAVPGAGPGAVPGAGMTGMGGAGNVGGANVGASGDPAVPPYVDPYAAEQYANAYAGRVQDIQGDFQNLKSTTQNWKGLSKEQKIRQAAIMAKTKGYSAQDLASVLPYDAQTIQRYL